MESQPPPAKRVKICAGTDEEPKALSTLVVPTITADEYDITTAPLMFVVPMTPDLVHKLKSSIDRDCKFYTLQQNATRKPEHQMTAPTINPTTGEGVHEAWGKRSHASGVTSCMPGLGANGTGLMNCYMPQGSVDLFTDPNVCKLLGNNFFYATNRMKMAEPKNTKKQQQGHDWHMENGFPAKEAGTNSEHLLLATTHIGRYFTVANIQTRPQVVDFWRRHNPPPNPKPFKRLTDDDIGDLASCVYIPPWSLFMWNKHLPHGINSDVVGQDAGRTGIVSLNYYLSASSTPFYPQLAKELSLSDRLKHPVEYEELNNLQSTQVGMLTHSPGFVYPSNKPTDPLYGNQAYASVIRCLRPEILHTRSNKAGQTTTYYRMDLSLLCDYVMQHNFPTIDPRTVDRTKIPLMPPIAYTLKCWFIDPSTWPLHMRVGFGLI